MNLNEITIQPGHSVLLFILVLFGCTRHVSSGNPEHDGKGGSESELADKPIADYVVEIFEDRRGTLWLGTMSKGVAKYDGDSLTYLSTEDGMSGSTVAGIVEDNEGNLWFGTHSGLSKYDGTRFTNYTTHDGLCNDRVSQLLVDHRGNLWIGTWGGICIFDGREFIDFLIPNPEVQLKDYQTTMDWVTEIIEDSKGNIWIGRDGYGATKYDGSSFTHFTKADGLASNNIQVIREDNQGNIWFGSRIAERDNPAPDQRAGDGGLALYDGTNLTRFSEHEGLHKSDIYSIYADRSGKVWIGANGTGIYCYDGNSFTLFRKTDRMDLTYNFGVQSILGDRNGSMWFGFSGGLFQLIGTTITHVPRNSLNN